MATANPTWGAPRIHGELRKLGIEIAESTVARYMPRRPPSPSPTWRTFMQTHLGESCGLDFFAIPTAMMRVLYGFVVVSHGRREIQHVAVTAHPTAAWISQQLREAFPWDAVPRYLHRDRDALYSEQVTRTIAHLGIEEVVSAFRSPWQNAFVERTIGSIRRELLDHVIVLGEQHATRLLRAYQRYFNESRTHLSLDKDAPLPRAVQDEGAGAEVFAIPQVGGLHHRYERRAA